MNLDQALQTYIEESRALLADMEAHLLRLEREPAEPDTLNALFRAAHTIKGSAGLFGLDPIVAFTHVVENLLDCLRDGKIPFSGELVELLLRARDHMSLLIATVAEAGESAGADLLAQGDALERELHEALGGDSAGGVPVQAPDPVVASGGGQIDGDVWQISIVFGGDVLRNGLDPISFIRHLATIGEIVAFSTHCPDMPPLTEMDPESCYLACEIGLRTGADKRAIEDVFDFMRDDCELHILPPASLLPASLERITRAQGPEDRVGEILVEADVVTPREVDAALALQESAGASQARPALGEVLIHQGDAPKAAVDAALAKQREIREHKVAEARFIRVHADKLDALINLVGELVIAGASAALIARRANDAALVEASSVVSRLVEEIRDNALTLRMVEIGETFNRFHRVVRDVAKELGKDIALEIRGAETELDKTVVEKIADPLTHLVRNAMDHGIEPAETRIARGKPARGTVLLSAHHDSGSIVIEVQDDGGGLNRERILRKAVERGLVGPSATLSDPEVFNLIFEPGFSTAEQVTNLSGRGVGMDVVRRNIEALRGSVEIASREGAGTTIRIRLPLTLAIIDGFLTRVGAASFVIPLDMVLECLELTAQTTAAARERTYIDLRGEVLPFIRLRAHFQQEGDPVRRENVVVVHCAGRKAGLVVDELLGEHQTVIKPLGKLFQNIQGISGSTILGSGEVALILDVPSLLQRTISQEARALAALTDAAR